MRITKFEFESTQKHWRLNPVAFSDLTLLVGLSGVGKTRILRSIASLTSVADGKIRPGIKWWINFVDEASRNCIWSGEFERLDDVDVIPEQLEFMRDEDDSVKKRARIIAEQLVVDERVVVSRENDQITLFGNKAPKLSPHESVVSLFKEESEIAPISKSFERIVYSDRVEVDGFSRMFAMISERMSKKYSDIDTIKQSSLPALVKLYLAHLLGDKVYSDIRSRFISVFPNVEDVNFGRFTEEDTPDFFMNAVFVQIKEYGVAEYIAQKDISSGMLRTLSHLAELYLSPPGTVILIDEFENSLGVNCIDAVTEDLLDTSSSIQFIITSHHPYIINNVSSDFWKVVCRKGSEVSAVDAADLNIGVSSHDAFLQLLNNEKYFNGIVGDGVSR